MSDIWNKDILICLDSGTLKALVKEVVGELKEEHFDSLNPWVNEKEAMHLLRISSKTTLQKYREEGNIEISSPGGKGILYRRKSVLAFIESKKIQ